MRLFWASSFALLLFVLGGAIGSARGQDQNIEALIRDSIKQINSDLESPMARYGLIKFAEDWQEARVAVPVAGYETSEEFKAGFEPLRGALNEAIFLESFSNDPPDELVGTMVDGYFKNYQTFEDFISKTNDLGYEFQILTQDEILRTQAQYSSILYHSNRDVWMAAIKRSHFLPFSEGF